jgi:hypothetical protein
MGPKTITVYVITWRYSGESGSGIVGAYASEEWAKKVFKALEDHGDMSKIFEMITITDVEV